MIILKIIIGLFLLRLVYAVLSEWIVSAKDVADSAVRTSRDPAFSKRQKADMLGNSSAFFLIMSVVLFALVAIALYTF